MKRLLMRASEVLPVHRLVDAVAQSEPLGRVLGHALYDLLQRVAVPSAKPANNPREASICPWVRVLADRDGVRTDHVVRSRQQLHHVLLDLPPDARAVWRCAAESAGEVRLIVARGHDPATVKKVERLLYIAEYKRRQAAPGVKISSQNFGRDRRYPITNKFREPL